MLSCAMQLLIVRIRFLNVPKRHKAKACSTKSVFSDVETPPPSEVFELLAQFQNDKHPKKVNCGIGAYRTNENQPFVFPVVKKCELEIVNDPAMNHEYFPMAGNADYIKVATELILGEDNRALRDNKVVAVQTCSGTNACRLAADFMAKVLKKRTVYIPNPTWENHIAIFQAAGFKHIEEYTYWNAKKQKLNMSKLLDSLCNAPEGAAVLFHSAAHNPTGMDPTHDEWRQIAALVKSRNLFPFFDSAYQGFASGDPDCDAFAVRFFVNQGFETMIAQSFSKNMGLYNERIGNLVVVMKDKKTGPAVRANLTNLIRVNYSNPPAFGSRIVAKVLSDCGNRAEWLKTIQEISERIILMRKQLVSKLAKFETPGNWDHVVKQCGMFSYTGLTEKQVSMLIKDWHIYLLKSGRMNICALNTKNIDYVAESISKVVKGERNEDSEKLKSKGDDC